MSHTCCLVISKKKEKNLPFQGYLVYKSDEDQPNEDGKLDASGKNHSSKQEEEQEQEQEDKHEDDDDDDDDDEYEEDDDEYEVEDEELGGRYHHRRNSIAIKFSKPIER